MRTSNGDKNIRSNNLGWYLLAEYTLGEKMPDSGKEYELTAGFLFQQFQEWGVPLELIGKIELTLTGFSQNTRMPAIQSRLERLGSFRVFCQKKVIDDVNAAKKSSAEHAESKMEPVPIKDPSGTKTNGGWGYFLIERGEGSSSTYSSEVSRNSVDLYLYKEGG